MSKVTTIGWSAMIFYCLLLGTRSSADDGDIFKTELTGVHVHSFTSTGNIIKFTVSGDTLLYAHSSNGDSGAIIWNEIGSGVVLNAFEPTGAGNDIEIVKFTTPTLGEWVFLQAESHGGDFGNIVETGWIGTYVTEYYAGDGNAIHGFEAYYPAKGPAILKVATGPLAIELVSFDATGQDGYVLIEWETASEIDLLGYNLKRSEDKNSGYAQINSGFIYGQGSAVDGASYSYKDTAVEPIHCYWYKLGEVDMSNSVTYHGPVKVEYMGKEAPESIYLDVHPGGGRNNFYIRYEIPGLNYESGIMNYEFPVSLKLYDISGRVEKVLFEGNLHCGSYGKDLDLSDFSSGIYFLRLEVGNKHVVRKLEIF